MKTEGASFAELERRRDKTISRLLIPAAIIGVAVWLCFGRHFTTEASGAQYNCGSPYQSVQSSAVAVPTGLVAKDAVPLPDLAAERAGVSACSDVGWQHIDAAIPIALIGFFLLWRLVRRWNKLEEAARTAHYRENPSSYASWRPPAQQSTVPQPQGKDSGD